MKKMFSITIFFFMLYPVSYSQGTYAGTKKSWIVKEYTEIENLSGLKGWTMVEGGMANSINDPEYIMSHVFKKGTNYVVIYSIMEDTASGKYKIMDVLEIAGVLKGWTVRSSFCRQNLQQSNYIIAWGKENTEEYMKLIKKVWKFNPDKRRIELIPVKGIDCENIGC